MTLDRSKARWKEGDPVPWEVLDARLKQWKSGDQYPFDLVILYDILFYSHKHQEPLPAFVVMTLTIDIEEAISGRDGTFFRKREGAIKHSTFPYAAYYQAKAVDYIARCKETGWDESPVKTVSEVCGVHRSAVHRWLKKYPAEPSKMTKEELQDILEILEYPAHGEVHGAFSKPVQRVLEGLIL